MSKSTSNNDISKAITDLRLEIKDDIKDLSTQVENIRISQAVSSTKIGAIVAGISILVSAMVSAIAAQIRSKL